MSPEEQTAKALRNRFPRVSGDEPPEEWPEGRIPRFSPRERG